METSDFLRRVRLQGNPHAHPRSVVVSGQARFTVLTPRLLRLEWSPTGVFTDDATFAFPNRYAETPPAFATHEEDGWLRIETGALTLRYRVGSGAFTAENLAIGYTLAGETRTWRPGLRDAENLRGTRRTLDNMGGEVPLEPGLVSRAGWALYDDSAGVVVEPEDGWVAVRPAHSETDWYFFGYGHDYPAALAEYRQFGGAVPLIPRYVLGVWWSRFWPYSDADLSRLVDDFAAHQIPLDVLVVDMDWHIPGHWTGYSWNRELFADPEAFLAEMHRRGLRVTLNLHPADGVLPHEDAYQALAAALGQDAAVGAPIPFRIGDRQFAEQYFALLHHPMEEQGVDFWWIDWQQGDVAGMPGGDPQLWLNHLHFNDARRRGQRPLLFSRWGGLGNHRYPIGFSGDTYNGWATLAALPHFTATAANVGFGWWSHDIGGHFGYFRPEDGELYTRWVQFGALSPCLRLHAVKHPLAERRPWAFTPDVLAAARAAFELRYALVPYLYTAARQMHEQNVALCRPMYYAFPEEESAYLARDQYMLGDDLLAAPITTPADPATGLTTQDVWMPPGTWYGFADGAKYVGPRWVRLSGNLDAMPLFARAGAIVPLARPALHLTDIPQDVLDVRIFPGADSTYRLYEDDDRTEAYLSGEYEWTPFTSAATGPDERTLRLGPAVGHCATLPTERAYTLTFMDADAPDEVLDDAGTPLPWQHDAATRTLRVEVAARSRREAFAVAVRGQQAERRPIAARSTPPFAHARAYTASDEAQRGLGHVVLVPPYGSDGQPQPCDVEVIWRNASGAGVAEVRQVVRGLAAETTLPVPFVLPELPQAARWSAEARFHMGDTSLTTITDGPASNPPVQRWAVRYAEAEQPRVYQATATMRFNTTAPYAVALDARAGASAVASATFDLPEAATLAFDTWTDGGLTLSIDGAPIETSEVRLQIAGIDAPLGHDALRYGPVTLAAGRHTLEAHLTAPEKSGDVGWTEAGWHFVVQVVDEAGQPFVRCATVVEE